MLPQKGSVLFILSCFGSKSEEWLYVLSGKFDVESIIRAQNQSDRVRRIAGYGVFKQEKRGAIKRVCEINGRR